MTLEQQLTTRTIADDIDDVLYAAVAMGLCDEAAVAAAINRVEQWHHAKLKRGYLKFARRTYLDAVAQIRSGWVTAPGGQKAKA